MITVKINDMRMKVLLTVALIVVAQFAMTQETVSGRVTDSVADESLTYGIRYGAMDASGECDYNDIMNKIGSPEKTCV